MGKGFNNYMSKKTFHPSSLANQKRIQEAEARSEAKKKHDEELLIQYQKEQELFQQKSLVSKESKEKLSLSFMYEAPPGLKETEKERPQKVEWKSSAETAGPSAPKQSTSIKPDPDAPVIQLEWKREKRRKVK